MKSPFPGMDPFIEARGLWADFHDNLIVEIQRALNEHLPAGYEALLGERTYIDVVDPESGSTTEFFVKPDVRVDGPMEGGKLGAALKETADVATSVLMHPEVAVSEREPFIEVRHLDSDDRVVTCIEVLSPTNKRPGSAGWGEYEQKRQMMFQGAANFVEIDLLRGGRRRQMREPWPKSPYYLLVMRQQQSPECRVWPAFSITPLPPIPIPLLAGDPDLQLDIQAAIIGVLAKTRYERRLRYHDSLKPPLNEAEQAFLTNGR
jgi:hypothetical protein